VDRHQEAVDRHQAVVGKHQAEVDSHQAGVGSHQVVGAQMHQRQGAAEGNQEGRSHQRQEGSQGQQALEAAAGLLCGWTPRPARHASAAAPRQGVRSNAPAWQAQVVGKHSTGSYQQIENTVHIIVVVDAVCPGVPGW
jgi:hypothetical protein